MADRPPKHARLSIAIICDDSRTQRLDRVSSQAKKNRSVFGRVDYSKEIGDILHSQRMTLPTDNIESESEYRKVLREYARPMEELLGGAFRSVSSLAKELDHHAIVDTYVLSRRYGLVKSDFVAIPYVCKRELYSLPEKDRWSIRASESFTTIASQYDVLVVLLSTSSLIALLGKKDPNPFGVMKSDQQLHIVAAESALARLKHLPTHQGRSKGPNLHVYTRVGVTPVTKSAKNEIILHIKEKVHG